MSNDDRSKHWQEWTYGEQTKALSARLFSLKKVMATALLLVTNWEINLQWVLVYIHRLMFSAVGLVYSVPVGARTLTQTSQDIQTQLTSWKVTFRLCPVTLPMGKELCHLIDSECDEGSRKWCSNVAQQEKDELQCLR